MRTLLPLLLLLSFAAVARADVGLPGFKFTSGSRVVHFGPEVEKYRVFVVCHAQCATLEPLADHTARVPHLGPRGYGESLCAIPADTPIPEKPTEEWLRSVPGVIASGIFRESLRRDHAICDPRDGYVLHYRATFTADELDLTLIEDKTAWSWPTVIVMGALSLALAFGGIWLIRRRRKPVTRTTPPPGT